MAGAFAATLAAALRHAGTPVVAQPAYAEAAPLDAEPVTVVGLTVTLDGQATHARAFVPTSFLASDAHGLGRAALAALGDVPLPLSLVAHRTLLTAGEVATLRRGDVLLFGASWKLGPARNLNGPVWLASSSSERALKAHLDGARLVLREGTEELGWSPMADELDEAGVIAAAVGEVPVIVRVELGAATMKAVEWASLRPGDVVALGSKIGAPVTVRVSGLAVAEGDLVDLEGEVGVRIRRRLPKQP
jgi:type III secretion system YscQ/HrcQ family protein